MSTLRSGSRKPPFSPRPDPNISQPLEAIAELLPGMGRGTACNAVEGDRGINDGDVRPSAHSVTLRVPPPRAGEELKALRFAGYAALFDRADRAGDVIRRGAFARAVTAGADGVPLLWQHDPARPIGRIDYLAEDKRGLRVIGRLSANGATAQEAAALLNDGAVRGLSFGYRVRGGCALGEGRELTDVELVEVSLVTFPMQPKAGVHAVEGARR